MDSTNQGPNTVGKLLVAALVGGTGILVVVIFIAEFLRPL
jgi:hypothetical protein